MTKAEQIEELINIEWQDFQHVINEGGRANCQDKPDTFFIMRRSFFLPLDEEVVSCVLRDFNVAHAEGRNLVSEKYAWMMKSTSKEKFREVHQFLRDPDFVAEALIELSIKYQLKCFEIFRDKYPRLAGKGRPLYTSQDTEQQTSFETYLRGELSTYSSETINKFYSNMKRLEESGDNIIFLTMEEEVKQYGYASLDDAEAHS